jgi:hypothetical protein
MPTDSTVVDIADAIVTALNGGTFSQAFTATRKFAPILDLKELSTLHVTVVPKESATTISTRASDLIDEVVDVAIQKKVTAKEGAPVDAMMKLVDEVRLFLRGLDVGITNAQWLRIKNEPIYAPEHLMEKSAFTSVITTTYKFQRIKT